MLKFTPNNLKKLEALLEELGYVLRFEKGNFQAGYCLVEQRKVVVINRFFDTEGRINCLLDILSKIPIEKETLTEVSQKVLKEAFADSE
jgi:hypothetical protein